PPPSRNNRIPLKSKPKEQPLPQKRVAKVTTFSFNANNNTQKYLWLLTMRLLPMISNGQEGPFNPVGYPLSGVHPVGKVISVAAIGLPSPSNRNDIGCSGFLMISNNVYPQGFQKFSSTW